MPRGGVTEACPSAALGRRLLLALGRACLGLRCRGLLLRRQPSALVRLLPLPSLLAGSLLLLLLARMRFGAQSPPPLTAQTWAQDPWHGAHHAASPHACACQTSACCRGHSCSSYTAISAAGGKLVVPPTPIGVRPPNFRTLWILHDVICGSQHAHLCTCRPFYTAPQASNTGFPCQTLHLTADNTHQDFKGLQTMT